MREMEFSNEEMDRINIATDKVDEALELAYGKGYEAGQLKGFAIAMALMRNSWNEAIEKTIVEEKREDVLGMIELISTLDEIGLE